MTAKFAKSQAESYKAVQSYRRQMLNLEEQHRKEVEEILRPMAERFARTELQHRGEPWDDWCFQMRLERGHVERCLQWGDADGPEILSLAEVIGRIAQQRALEALRTRNIVRTCHQSQRESQGERREPL